MKKILYALLALTIMAGGAMAQAKKEKIAPGPLDNKSFIVEITKDGKKKGEPIKDEFKFKKGTFANKMLTDAVYLKAAAYDATFDSTAKPMTCAFTVEAKDESENTFKWEGTITYGDEITIEGTAAILNKKGKQKESYTYTGTIKGAKKAAPAKK